VSYLKDLPCETCGTKSIYAFPNWPDVCYCYCSFRDEIGELIAREIEAMEFAKGMSTDGSQSGFYSAKKLAAAIARGVDEQPQSQMSTNDHIFQGVVVTPKNG
jgi:hypothetical protein